MRKYKKSKKISLIMFLIISILIPLSTIIGKKESQITYLPLLMQLTSKKSLFLPEITKEASSIQITSDFIFTGDIKEPIVVAADNIVIDGNGYTLQGSGNFGFYLNGRSNVTIKRVAIKGWLYGILLQSSSGNIIIGNEITSNSYYGISMPYSSNNNISGNKINKNGWFGIMISHSSNNNIVGNNISRNQYGVRDIFSSNTSIYENYITKNRVLGIELCFSSGALVYHNNFINNTRQAHDRSPAENNWHHPALLEGNFWSDYPGIDDGSGTEKHAVAGDCIGDTDIPWPYSAYDNYPYLEENGWRYVEEEFEGYGKLRIGRKRYRGKASLFLSEDTIRLEIKNQSASWDITKRCEKEYCDFYRGTGDLGKIALIIIKFEKALVFAMGRRVYFFGYSCANDKNRKM